MKCVCGYDDSTPDKDLFDNPKFMLVSMVTTPSTISMTLDKIGRMPVYICPKCGTLKVEICNNK